MAVVYIAGPYTQGDVTANVYRALDVATLLLDAGMTPIVPHLSHWWDRLYPRDYQVWIDYDLRLLAKADILLRLPGESPGADGEVARAFELGIPVVHTVAEAIAEARDV